MKKNIKIIILVSIISFIVLILSYFISIIIIHSFLSVKTTCFPPETEEESDVIVLGYFQVNESGGSEISINVPRTYPELRLSTIKHELCHKKQFEKNRLFNCFAGGTFLFINENECYIAQKLNNNLYQRLYYNISKFQ